METNIDNSFEKSNTLAVASQLRDSHPNLSKIIADSQTLAQVDASLMHALQYPGLIKIITNPRVLELLAAIFETPMEYHETIEDLTTACNFEDAGNVNTILQNVRLLRALFLAVEMAER